MNDRSTPSLRLYLTRRFLIARTAGVGSGMCVPRRVVEANAASPAGASRMSPSVRSKGVRRIGRRLVPGEERLRAGSGEGEEALERVLSLRNRRSVFSVLRSRRSRNGRSPSGEAPSPDR